MAQYRLQRNLEASLVQYIEDELANDGWTGIEVEKSFHEAADLISNGTPAILVNADGRGYEMIELASVRIFNDVDISIRIFATNDGQRLDLADWLTEKLLPGVDYYQYTITNGAISNKQLVGRINILDIVDNRKELVNVENLEKQDKYRHLFILSCRVSLS